MFIRSKAPPKTPEIAFQKPPKNCAKSSYKNFTNDYWVTMVYVDSYEDNVMRGWFSNPYLKEPEKFSCLSDFIIKMECMLDLMGLEKPAEMDGETLICK